MEIVKNKVYQADITDLGDNGFGIGKIGDFTVFVNGALPQEKVEVKVIKVKKNYCIGRLEKLLTESPHRVHPPCPIYRRCGGCQFMDLSYREQLKLKKKRVEDCLQRIGGFHEVTVDETVGMDNPYGYRNKAQFPVGWENGEVQIGFYAQKSHNIINCEECLIQNQVNRDILLAMKKYMADHHVRGYDEETGEGDIRHIFTRIGYKTKEIMVCLVINHDTLPEEKALVHELRGIPDVSSILVSINKKKTNVILGDDIRVIWGKKTITDYIGDTGFQISARSFFQINPVQTLKLYRRVMALADFRGEETVVDLYCGIGTISLFAARYVRAVVGIEIVPEAIDDARDNARLNGIGNAFFYAGKAEEVIPDLYEKGQRGEVVILDPPRKGCEAEVLEIILKMEPEKILYVSCDPATLARDLKRLCDSGKYQVKRVCPFDMFPQTGHVETVCLLSKLNMKQHIEVDIHMDELDLTDAEKKATYSEIKEYVLKQTGLKVSSLYVAQVKQKCGIIERENYNKPKSEDARQPQCPPDKEKAIKEALLHFGMI